MKTIEIIKMSFAIEEYLEKEKLFDAKPKDLIPFLIEKDFFNKDHREGLPLREVLRDLDRKNQLYLIPQVRADRKDINTNWFFSSVKNSTQLSFNNLLLVQDEILQDSFNRYNSWLHCYKVFGNKFQKNDYLALHLGFYLASWGMYRGSSQLLQKDFYIHSEVANIIKQNYNLHCDVNKEITHKDVIQILELKKQLSSHYSTNGVSPTDTLISKILLGTLGCSPAFDQYFLNGIKVHEQKFNKLDEYSFELIFKFIEKYETELYQLQKDFYSTFKIHYPIMKLIDMYFWHEGFLWNEAKSRKWKMENNGN